jgi:hypothetical protein
MKFKLISKGETNFSRFCYSNSDKEISWDLIQNKTSNSIQKGVTQIYFQI